jgi:hypothetical protein
MGHDKLFQKRKALSRKPPSREIRRILIVCEGDQTEPNYFRSFPTKPEVCDKLDVEGTGFNTLSLVREAIRLKQGALNKHTPYREVWCVFDRDSFPLENFTKALSLAASNQINCAYSVEAFEIWYLLHFNYIDAALSRTQYEARLSELLKRQYLKNAGNMYDLLKKYQSKAIQNAKRLFTKQSVLPLSEQNPITTVYQLVERLNG